MKFRVQGQPWPLGDQLIPSGTVIDMSLPVARTGSATPAEIATHNHSRAVAAHFGEKAVAPPPNASALDAEAYDALAKLYGAGAMRDAEFNHEAA